MMTPLYYQVSSGPYSKALLWIDRLEESKWRLDTTQPSAEVVQIEGKRIPEELIQRMVSGMDVLRGVVQTAAPFAGAEGELFGWQRMVDSAEDIGTVLERVLKVDVEMV